MSDWAIIGVGNRFRGDDSVGPYVVHRLRSQLTPSIPCIENNGDMTNLIEDWRDRRVCLVDAVQTAAYPPGEVVRLNGLKQDIPASLCRTSSHGLNIGEALELARALEAMPAHLEIYAICGRDFSFSAGLSAQVKAAAQQVMREILEKIQLQTGGL